MSEKLPEGWNVIDGSGPEKGPYTPENLARLLDETIEYTLEDQSWVESLPPEQDLDNFAEIVKDWGLLKVRAHLIKDRDDIKGQPGLTYAVINRAKQLLSKDTTDV